MNLKGLSQQDKHIILERVINSIYYINDFIKEEKLNGDLDNSVLYSSDILKIIYDKKEKGNDSEIKIEIYSNDDGNKKVFSATINNGNDFESGIKYTDIDIDTYEYGMWVYYINIFADLCIKDEEYVKEKILKK